MLVVVVAVVSLVAGDPVVPLLDEAHEADPVESHLILLIDENSLVEDDDDINIVEHE